MKDKIFILNNITEYANEIDSTLKTIAEIQNQTKIHYDSDEFEEQIKKLFPGKATIYLAKESNRSRYQVVKNLNNNKMISRPVLKYNGAKFLLNYN